jgi:hypothetical protein
MITNKMQTSNAQRPTPNAQGVRPIAIARELFRRYVEPIAGITFEERLAHDLGTEDCFVISSPVAFAMGTIVQLGDRQRAWFFELAFGTLEDLLKAIPFPLPFVAFKREVRGNSRIRVVPLEHLYRISKRQHAMKPEEKS